MKDDELLRSFENSSLSPEQWTHHAHVRVAFQYALAGDFDTATDRMRAGIKAYNKKVNTPEAIDQGYHETMTQAFMRLLFAAVLKTGPHDTSAKLCEENPELLSKLVLRNYYSRERLLTWEAKESFVEPDLKPLSATPFVSIAPMHRMHLPAVIELWQTTEGLILTQSDNASDLMQFLEHNPNMSQVAIQQGRILGAVLCGQDGRRGYLHHLAVAEHMRGQGTGKRLVNACLSSLRRAAIRQCNLFIVDDHQQGREFWDNDGWSEWPNIRLMSKAIE